MVGGPCNTSRRQQANERPCTVQTDNRFGDFSPLELEEAKISYWKEWNVEGCLFVKPVYV